MKILKNNNAITLMSLVITVIILIILASVGTYSGIQIINSSKLTAFTTELKIMQTQVNELYDKASRNEINVNTIGKDISTVQTQANKVFTEIEDEIDSQDGYRYYDKNTIKSLGIEGVEGEFFVNVSARSVVSYDGLKYEGNTYYTLQQLPDSLYNVNYEEKNTWDSEIDSFDVNYAQLQQGKYRITVSNIDYKSGNINSWQVKYKKEEEDNWKELDNYSFIIDEVGNYKVKIANDNIESNEKRVIVAQSLPPEYQQVEYIESTGNQYINTNIIGTQDIIIDTEFSWTQYLSRWNFFFNAMAQSSDGNWYGIGQASSNRNTRFNMGGGVTGNQATANTTVYSNIAYNDFNKHHYLMNNFQITVDGINVYSIETKNDFSTIYPISIFANNKAGTIVEYSYAKLYRFKIYDINTKLIDYIPCYSTTTVTDVDGIERPKDTIGLYDIVNGQFYVNKGSGTFEKGDNIYGEKIEYIIITDM